MSRAYGDDMFRGIFCTVAVIGVLVVVPAIAVSADAGNTERAAVALAYQKVLVPTLTGGTGWTGSTSDCAAGSTSATSKRETLASVNYMRDLAGLDPVRFTARYNDLAQQAALVYHAQGDISHAIPKSWDCYTSGAATAGSKSNLAIGPGASGAEAIPLYMSEPGAGNTLVGHRRWILNPGTDDMGTGATTTNNVLWVISPAAKTFTDPAWVAWPSAGYFPSELEPNGRWSLSGDSTQDYNFTKAKVTVTATDGTKLKVTTHAQQKSLVYGSDSLVWEVAGVHETGNYAVRVSGIKRDGHTVTRAYTVKLFKAALT